MNSSKRSVGVYVKCPTPFMIQIDQLCPGHNRGNRKYNWYCNKTIHTNLILQMSIHSSNHFPFIFMWYKGQFCVDNSLVKQQMHFNINIIIVSVYGWVSMDARGSGFSTQNKSLSQLVSVYICSMLSLYIWNKIPTNHH